MINYGRNTSRLFWLELPIFYERFSSNMGSGTFIGMAKDTPDSFEFSLKVPETVTHRKRLSVADGAMEAFEAYPERISPSCWGYQFLLLFFKY